MPAERRARVAAALSSGLGRPSSAGRLCQCCADVVGVTGAGIMLMAADEPRGSLCTSDALSEMIEDLQFTLGEGPCVDAYRTDRAVSEPDLAGSPGTRWPAFTEPVVRAGARALFAFPLRTGTVLLGALDLYRDAAGPLDEDQHADALVTADMVARWVLDTQAGSSGVSLADSLGAGTDLRFIVHNAAGVLSVQIGVSVPEALLRLRAYAFSQDRPIREVAADVVARKLRLP